MLLFEEKIKQNKPAFVQKEKLISNDLEIDPNWLMAVMNSESGINSKAVNPTSNAVGLIQIMPDTALQLGTTTEALYNMSNVDQLSYVYKYLLPFKGKMKSYIDVYNAVFFPAAIGKSDDYVLKTSKISASAIARENSVFDLNKDAIITLGELKKAFMERVPESLQAMLETSKTHSGGIVVAITFLIIGTFLIFNNS